MANTLISSGCYTNWNLFLGGLNLSQAQAEANALSGGGIYNSGTSGYWFCQSQISGSSCASSCLKYGFIYAAIEP